MEEPMPGTRGITKSEISEFFTDEWYVAVDGMEAVVNGEANAQLVATARALLAVLEAVAVGGPIGGMIPDIFNLVAAAIAKAKGE